MPAPQPYAEDVRVGMDIPPVVKHPTNVQVVMLSGLMWLWHRIHYDQAFARVDGCPDVVVHGPLQGNFMAQMLTDWIGPRGTLRKIG